MKHLQRYLVPIIVLAALALGAIGVAFAREMSESQFNAVTSKEVEFTGVVESINGNTWTIDGRSVVVDLSTELKGFISAGQVVKVHASMDAGGSLVAREIELAGAAGVEDANANDNMDDDAFENANDNMDDDAFENANANDNVDDSLFEDDNANDNVAGVMENENENDNAENEHLGENSNDNSSSWNEDNSNSNSSWNDDHSNDNSSSLENDNSQGTSHDDHNGNDNHQDDSGQNGGDDRGDD